MEHDAEMYVSLEFDFYIFTVTAIYCDCIGEKNIKEYKLIFPNVCHFSLKKATKPRSRYPQFYSTVRRIQSRKAEFQHKTAATTFQNKSRTAS